MDKRQIYHLEPNVGLLNDPNGLAYFNGVYHVFFQWNRFDKDHSYKEWGHFTSENLINWTFEGSALLPDQLYDKNGVYSGSSYVKDNELCLFYTGNNKDNGKRKSSQCLATTEDGQTFVKKGIILPTPSEYTEHFRDPKVWHTLHGYYMVLGAQRKNGKGAIALCASKNGVNWKFLRTVAVSTDYEMIECPDLLRLDGSDVLIYCLQHRDNTKDLPLSSFSAYKMTLFDDEKGVLSDSNLDRNFKVLDYGFDFYAPQTFEALDGRKILFAWMSRMNEQEEVIFSQNEMSIHCMTLPRELSLIEGELCQTPIQELEECLVEYPNIQNDAKESNIAFANRSYCLKLGSLTMEKSLCIILQNKEVIISYDKNKKVFCVNRINWTNGMMEEKFCEVSTLESLEIWSDNSSVEVFINNGKRVFSLRVYPKTTCGSVKITGVSKKITLNAYKILIKERGGL